MKGLMLLLLLTLLTGPGWIADIRCYIMITNRKAVNTCERITALSVRKRCQLTRGVSISGFRSLARSLACCRSFFFSSTAHLCCVSCFCAAEQTQNDARRYTSTTEDDLKKVIFKKSRTKPRRSRSPTNSRLSRVNSKGPLCLSGFCRRRSCGQRKAISYLFRRRYQLDDCTSCCKWRARISLHSNERYQKQSIARTRTNQRLEQRS